LEGCAIMTLTANAGAGPWAAEVGAFLASLQEALTIRKRNSKVSGISLYIFTMF